MRLSGASLLQSLPNNDFRTVASGAQHGFVESRNNSSWQSPAIVAIIIDDVSDWYWLAFGSALRIGVVAWLEPRMLGWLFVADSVITHRF